MNLDSCGINFPVLTSDLQRTRILILVVTRMIVVQLRGFVLQMNGCTYAYKSRKQTIAYEDTCSTNFIAAAEGSVMIIWTHNLREELDLRRSHPTVLFQDNQSTIKVIEATKFNYKTKSAELKFHKTRDLYEVETLIFDIALRSIC